MAPEVTYNGATHFIFGKLSFISSRLSHVVRVCPMADVEINCCVGFSDEVWK